MTSSPTGRLSFPSLKPRNLASGGTYTVSTPIKGDIYAPVAKAIKAMMEVDYAKVEARVMARGVERSAFQALPKGHLAGLRFESVPSLVKVEPDFSACRSKGRARRRFKRGVLGRVTYLAKPITRVFVIDGVAYAHPSVIRAIEEAVPAR